MRKWTFFLLLACLAGCGEKSATVVITGKVPEGVKVVRLLSTDMSSSRLAQDTVGSDGGFHLEYTPEHPVFLRVESGDYKYRAQLFVYPGDRQQIVFTPDEKVFFEGDGAENNRFTQLLQAKSLELSRSLPVGRSNPAELQRMYLQNNDSLLDMLREAGIKDDLYVRTQQHLVTLNTYHSIFYIPSFMKLLGGIDTILPSSFFAFAQDLKFNDPALRNLENMNDFLKNYFSVMETNGFLKTGITDFIQKRAERIGDPVVRENYVVYALAQELGSGNQQLPEIMDSVKALITLPGNQKKFGDIQAKYGEWQQKYARLAPGSPAFDFTGKDRKDQPFSLESCKGKIVVVDVWSTNCIPCIGEIPYLQRVERHFEGRDVAFVSYSVDIRSKKWSDFIEQRKMEGIQLVDTLGPKSGFVQHYAIHSTPRLLLFDKEGQLADAFAPRPSDPRLTLKIEELLK